jgi:type VI protein secretion system component VasK
MIDEKMEAFFNYITEPWTIISLIVFIFWLWATWSSLNWRIKECEKRLDRVDELDLDSRLTRMEANLEWIRTTLEKLEHLHN